MNTVPPHYRQIHILCVHVGGGGAVPGRVSAYTELGRNTLLWQIWLKSS